MLKYAGVRETGSKHHHTPSLGPRVASTELHALPVWVLYTLQPELPHGLEDEVSPRAGDKDGTCPTACAPNPYPVPSPGVCKDGFCFHKTPQMIRSLPLCSIDNQTLI